jgi:hypothetical protein
MPFETVLLESIFARNLINHYKRSDTNIFFGPDSMKRLPDLLSGREDMFRLTLDWSRFDSTIPRFLLEDVFQIVKSFIDF